MGKRRPATPQAASQASSHPQKSRQSLGTWHIGGVVVATAGVGLAAIWQLSGTSSSSSFSDDLPIEFRGLLRCSDMCKGGGSEDDLRFIEGAIKKLGANMRNEMRDPLTVCMWRCDSEKKKPHEEVSAGSLDDYTRLPPYIVNYHKTAKACSETVFRSAHDVLAGLETCGVVHLETGSIVSDALLSELQSTLHGLLDKDSAYASRVDWGHLRGKRGEFWPPFRPPFNASELLWPTNLASVFKQYLGTDAILDHVSVIVAPATTTPEAQEIHADVDRFRRHLEIHIPLTDVPEDMGPTKFCPNTQGRGQRDRPDSNTSDYRTLEWWYLTPGKHCTEEASLSYIRPLRAGQVTIYDANVYHAGTANRAQRDRPVLQLSWAASRKIAKERAYFEDSFGAKKDDPAKKRIWDLVSADAEAFRLASEAIGLMSVSS